LELEMSSERSLIEQLADLERLHADGLLTDQEFEEIKGRFSSKLHELDKTLNSVEQTTGVSEEDSKGFKAKVISEPNVPIKTATPGSQPKFVETATSARSESFTHLRNMLIAIACVVICFGLIVAMLNLSSATLSSSDLRVEKSIEEPLLPINLITITNLSPPPIEIREVIFNNDREKCKAIDVLKGNEKKVDAGRSEKIWGYL
jgi:hypothetical protein